jgi:RimJ/RimL family protein N-acetyltransferase
MRIDTPRLELRTLPPEAAGLILSDRPAAERLIGAALADGWPAADLLDILPAQAAATAETAPWGIWTLIDLVDDTVIGEAGFLGPPDPDGAVEMGYSIVPERRGRRLASEAAAALAAWAFGHGARTVIATTDPDNIPSMRTLEASGFERAGERDGLILWERRAG